MYELKKLYRNHYGLDLKSSDLDRPDHFASDLLNAQYRSDGSLEKRRGFQAVAQSEGGHGLFVYNYIDPVTAKTTQELISIAQRPYKLQEATIALTYTGLAASGAIKFFFDVTTSEYKCQILEGTTPVLDLSLGKGFDESPIVLLSDLKTAIDAISGFSLAITGPTTVPAAFIEVIRGFDYTQESFTATASYWSQINTTVTSPFAGSETNKNDSDFENATAVQLNGVFYISNGYDELQKYDGQTCYRAGLPTGSLISAADSGSGSGVNVGAHRYKVVYAQLDNANNLIESQPSSFVSVTLASARNVNVTVGNILNGSGFNTNCGVVVGLQTSVTTITVDDGASGAHTLRVGDTAYFFDGVSSSYVTRRITATTATTITIEGAAVTVADNAVISNNLRIGIYRTVAGGTLVYNFVEEIPNNAFSANQVFLDTIADASLGFQLVEPIIGKERSLPPRGKYVSAIYNQLVIAGNFELANNVYYSDVTSPEHFPGLNFVRCQSKNGDTISGVAQSNEVLAVFERNAMHIISGDFTNDNIRQDIISQQIGCVAHATIQQVEQSLFFLSDKGIYETVSGQLPRERSARIEPLFDQRETLQDILKYKFKRAIGVVDRLRERYLLFLPTESTAGSNVYTNDNYLIVVDDFSHNTELDDVARVYLKWRIAGTNPAGGFVVFNNKLHFVERRLSASTTFVEHILYRELSLDDPYDYMDNTEPVDFLYKTAWYTGGEPSVFKRWTRLKLFAIPGEEATAGGSDITIQTEADYVADLVRNEVTVDLSASGLGYGNNPYGIAPYGDPAQPNIKTKLGGKYKSMRIIYSNSEPQQSVRIQGWELEISAAYRPELKD